LPRIALFLPEPSNPYQQSLASQAVATSQRLGVELMPVFFAEAGDLTEQVRQIYRVISAPERDRPDAIMTMPVQESALHSITEKVLGLGIGVVFLNRTASDLRALRQGFPGIPVGFVTPDQAEAGRIQARQVGAVLPGGGNVICVQGRASNTSAQGRLAGFREGIGAAKLEIATTLEGGWKTETASAVVGKWLRTMLPTGYRIDAVACQSDLMAAGVLQALQELAGELKRPELSCIPVFGMDGVENIGRRLVDEAKLAATVVMPLTTEKAVQLVSAWYRDREPMPLRVVLAPSAYPRESAMVRRSTAKVAVA
jgi:ABC-type sugar transport system substrate-binding protein